MNKRFFRTILLACSAALFSACEGSIIDPPADPTLEIEASRTQLEFGDTLQLAARLVDGDGAFSEPAAIEWSSSDSTVVGVSSDGLVEAIGSGSATIQADAGEGMTAEIEVTVDPVEFTAVSAGMAACALDREGRAYCWGPGVAPVPERIPGDVRFDGISVGYPGFSSAGGSGYTACGLTAEGDGYCWGNNHSGQFGNGTSQSSEAPVRVLADEPLADIAVGQGHACAVGRSGMAYCWGDNREMKGGYAGASSAIPVALATDLRFVAISAGDRFNCGTTADGEVWCWGFNERGRLGPGWSNSASYPEPQLVQGSDGWGIDPDQSTTSGGDFSCALAMDSTLNCWGVNWGGKTGASRNEGVPGSVSAELKFSEFAVSFAHGCGVALDGQLYCWASNNYGEGAARTTERCGPGSYGVTSCLPTPAETDLVFTELSAGWGYTCGFTADGLLWCWGQEEYVGRVGVDRAVCPNYGVSRACVIEPTLVAGQREP